ncbi:MAG: PTS sugar transporter subunit IIA [Pseudomonadota bacterium]
MLWVRLTATHLKWDVAAHSLKSVFAALAQLVHQHVPKLDAEVVFDRLTERERLGSTALNNGVALPHVQCPELTAPLLLVLRTEKALPIAGPEQKPVDIFFALFTPQGEGKELLDRLYACLHHQSWPNTLRQITVQEAVKLISVKLTPLEP